MTNRAHKITLDPTDTQEEYFRRACGVSRFAYNWALAEWKRQYYGGEKPDGRSLLKQFNAIRHIDFPWSGEVLRDAISQPFRNLDKAFKNFFKNTAKYPKFKKKGIHDSFYIANDQFKVEEKRIRIPHIGWVRMRESLRFSGKILSAVVSRMAHRWFVSISVEIPDVPITNENQVVVGVDLGIKALATLSTGEKFLAPKPLKDSLEKLRRLSRQFSRKQKGSNRREKARNKLARLHYRISCIRADFLHKVTTSLVKRFGTIVIEDLNVKGMIKNHCLSRAISDVGFGEFRRQLEYKVEASGGRLVIADRWFPSSKTCSDCGFVLDSLELSVREWGCPSCGVVHDRDINAAMNLKNLAASSAVAACRLGSSGSPRKRRAKLPIGQEINTGQGMSLFGSV